jgi:hypothetical protein
MPGIFGAVGCSPTFYEALEQEFSSTLDDCQTVRLAEGILGGHALRSKFAVHEMAEDRHVAVDGEGTLYRDVELFIHRASPTLFRVHAGRLELNSACKGNVALIDARSGTCYLAAEWTGTFPLYYIQRDGAFVFSSHLRPLARVFNAMPDSVGIVEFLGRGYMLSGRTYYQGIRRILPGQAITYEALHQRLCVYEMSSAWVGTERSGLDVVEHAADAARKKDCCCRRCVAGKTVHACAPSEKCSADCIRVPESPRIKKTLVSVRDVLGELNISRRIDKC